MDNELKESIKSVDLIKSQHETEKAQLEAQYREKIALLQAQYEKERESNSKNNEDIAEKMQKEIESVQLVWKEENQKLMNKLQTSHKNEIENMQAKLAAAHNQVEQVYMKQSKFDELQI